jgi:hypothetical protein
LLDRTTFSFFLLRTGLKVYQWPELCRNAFTAGSNDADMDGMQFCRRIRSKVTLQKFVVIMISALDNREARLAGWKLERMILNQAFEAWKFRSASRISAHERFRTLWFGVTSDQDQFRTCNSLRQDY